MAQVREIIWILNEVGGTQTRTEVEKYRVKVVLYPLTTRLNGKDFEKPNSNSHFQIPHCLLYPLQPACMGQFFFGLPDIKMFFAL
jgi:hypothetical protein